MNTDSSRKNDEDDDDDARDPKEEKQSKQETERADERPTSVTTDGKQKKTDCDCDRGGGGCKEGWKPSVRPERF